MFSNIWSSVFNKRQFKTPPILIKAWFSRMESLNLDETADIIDQ